MQKIKFLIIENYVKEFDNCKFLITREYKIKIEERLLFSLSVIGIIFLVIRIFINSWILLMFGVVLIIIAVFLFKFTLAKIPVYIIDRITYIRHAADIDYDVKNRRSEIRQTLKKDYGSYINTACRDNYMPLVFLQAKQIIDHDEIRTKSLE